MRDAFRRHRLELTCQMSFILSSAILVCQLINYLHTVGNRVIILLSALQNITFACLHLLILGLYEHTNHLIGFKMKEREFLWDWYYLQRDFGSLSKTFVKTGWISSLRLLSSFAKKAKGKRLSLHMSKALRFVVLICK